MHEIITFADNAMSGTIRDKNPCVLCCLVGVEQICGDNGRVITVECKYCNVICTQPNGHSFDPNTIMSSRPAALGSVLKLGLSQIWLTIGLRMGWAGVIQSRPSHVIPVFNPKLISADDN